MKKVKMTVSINKKIFQAVRIDSNPEFEMNNLKRFKEPRRFDNEGSKKQKETGFF